MKGYYLYVNIFAKSNDDGLGLYDKKDQMFPDIASISFLLSVMKPSFKKQS